MHRTAADSLGWCLGELPSLTKHPAAFTRCKRHRRAEPHVSTELVSGLSVVSTVSAAKGIWTIPGIRSRTQDIPFRSLSLPALRGDEDDAVGAVGAVGGGGTGVLEDLDPRDVRRGDAGEGAAESSAAREGHAIEDDERRGVRAIRRGVANAEGEVAVRQRHDLDAGDAAAQELLDAGDALLADLRARDAGDGSGDVSGGDAT